MPTDIEAKCNSCTEENGIACFNETSFYMCFNGIADTSLPLTCSEGKICTRSSLKCVKPGMGMDPDCNFNKGCGICDNTKMFTCTSRTTFAQCNGYERTNITGVCPPGWTCDSSNTEVCVNDCNLPAQLECERETPL